MHDLPLKTLASPLPQETRSLSSSPLLPVVLFSHKTDLLDPSAFFFFFGLAKAISDIKVGGEEGKLILHDSTVQIKIRRLYIGTSQ